MIAVGDLVTPNRLARLAGYGKRDGGQVAELRADELGELHARIGAVWWHCAWLDPGLDEPARDRRAEMLEHGRGRLGRSRR